MTKIKKSMKNCRYNDRVCFSIEKIKRAMRDNKDNERNIVTLDITEETNLLTMHLKRDVQKKRT